MEKDPYADIISQDEVHFMLGTLVTRGWYLTGSIPIVGSAPCKAGIPLSGFVSIKTGVTFVTSPERFTWESTIAGVDPLSDDTYDSAGVLIGDLIDEFIEAAK